MNKFKKFLIPVAAIGLLLTTLVGCGQPLGEIFDPSGNPFGHRFSDMKDIRAATFVVAASDSEHKYDVDFRCDGIADNIQIQAAIDALPASGGKVLLLEGRFNITTAITIAKKNVFLEGIGYGNYHQTSYGTFMYLVDGSNCNMIDLAAAATDCGIYNLQLFGNKDNQTGGDAAIVSRADRLTIQNVEIVYSYRNGLRLYDGNDNSFTNIRIYNCRTQGIWIFSPATDNYFSQILIGNCGYDGLLVASSSNFFDQVHIWGTTDDGVGVTIRDCSNIHFNELYIENNNRQGLKIDTDTTNTQGILISNSRFWENSQDGAGTFQHIYLNLTGAHDIQDIHFVNTYIGNYPAEANAAKCGIELRNIGTGHLRRIQVVNSAFAVTTPWVIAGLVEDFKVLECSGALGIGETKTFKKVINYDDASPVAICTVADGYCVTDVWVHVTTLFDDAGARIDIGDGVDPNGYLDRANINQAVVGYYTIESDLRGDYLWDAANSHPRVRVYTGADTVDAVIVKTNGTQGVAEVYVKVVRIGD